MRIMKSILLLTFVFLMGTIMQSCNDKCNNTVCENSGICADGNCICPDGYLGTACENFDLMQVQALLDSGKTPLELINGGIPLDSLYGKVYKGGFLFYLDASNGTGLVAALEDQSTSANWGCYLKDIVELPNNLIGNNLMEIASYEFEDIGKGFGNTNKIIAECDETDNAARLCRNKGPDWFLPSIEELSLMHTNLHRSGLGGFSNYGGSYWSSTEIDEYSAFTHVFNHYDITLYPIKKLDITNVRAAKAF